jgi:hypothetical protein
MAVRCVKALRVRIMTSCDQQTAKFGLLDGVGCCDCRSNDAVHCERAMNDEL